MAHYVIYLPGVGDHQNANIQIMALQRWQKFGLKPHFQPIGWNTGESYKSKRDKILRVIDELPAQDIVSLVGASAGASMAANVYALRKPRINSTVLICGKINNPQTLGDNYKNKYPALLDSVMSSAQSTANLTGIDRQKILTLFPVFDGTVAKKDALIPGVKNETLFSLTHSLSIYLALTLYKRKSISFLKSKAVQ